MKEVFCKHCGCRLVEGDSFCRLCGKRIVGEGAVSGTRKSMFSAGESKKLILIAAAIFVIVFAGIGIRSLLGNGIEGTWTITKIKLDGMSRPEKIEDAVRDLAEKEGQTSEEEIQKAMGMFTDFKMTIYENGTVVMQSSGNSLTGNWVENGKGNYIFKTENGEPANVTVKFGKMTILEDDGTEAVILEKE